MLNSLGDLRAPERKSGGRFGGALRRLRLVIVLSLTAQEIFFTSSQTDIMLMNDSLAEHQRLGQQELGLPSACF